jgi:recombination protein RecA
MSVERPGGPAAAPLGARITASATASGELPPRRVPTGAPRWCLAELAGRLVELCGWRAGGTYSAALALVVDAQRSGESAVWVGPRARTFYPPDAEAAGVDLAALPVVRVPDGRALPFVVDVLARSGAFGLVLVDLGSSVPTLGVLSRLAGLARAHEAAIVLMTEKSPERASLGSVVSLRADAWSGRAADGSFATTLAVTRDRVRATPWRIVEPRRGPPGLS